MCPRCVRRSCITLAGSAILGLRFFGNKTRMKEVGRMPNRQRRLRPGRFSKLKLHLAEAVPRAAWAWGWLEGQQV